jgi:hypothetical protein
MKTRLREMPAGSRFVTPLTKRSGVVWAHEPPETVRVQFDGEAATEGLHGDVVVEVEVH